MEADKTKDFSDPVENSDWFEVLGWCKHRLHLCKIPQCAAGKFVHPLDRSGGRSAFATHSGRVHTEKRIMLS